MEKYEYNPVIEAHPDLYEKSINSVDGVEYWRDLFRFYNN